MTNLVALLQNLCEARTFPAYVFLPETHENSSRKFVYLEKKPFSDSEVTLRKGFLSRYGRTVFERWKEFSPFRLRTIWEKALKKDWMIDSLLEELPQRGGCDENGADRSQRPIREPSEYSILAALPIVRRIVSRRHLKLDPANVSDLVQDVALRIWQWRAKYQDRSDQMSGEDWNSFAARTAYNEVNRHFSRESRPADLPLETVSEIEQQSVFEGQTDVEVFSLIDQVWQATCNLSLRQRRSLLLHSQELIIYFLQIGIAENDLADVLDFSETVWCTVRDRLPMTDSEIAELADGTAGSIKKARYEARLKLENSIRR